MKTRPIKEIALISIVLIPFIYLGYIWNSLEEKVPVHWNGSGEIDRYGDKSELIIIPILLPLLSYLIFLFIPKIDPKGKIASMGAKYHQLKMLLVTFMSVLAMYILYASKTASLNNPNGLTLLLGLLFIVLGNYAKTIKPNYFIGVRTPWTLESAEVWNETHRSAGKLWFIGGLLIVICSILLPNDLNRSVFLSIVLLISITPIVQSYLLHQKHKTSK